MGAVGATRRGRAAGDAMAGGTPRPAVLGHSGAPRDGSARSLADYAPALTAPNTSLAAAETSAVGSARRPGRAPARIGRRAPDSSDVSAPVRGAMLRSLRAP